MYFLIQERLAGLGDVANHRFNLRLLAGHNLSKRLASLFPWQNPVNLGEGGIDFLEVEVFVENR